MPAVERDLSPKLGRPAVGAEPLEDDEATAILVDLAENPPIPRHLLGVADPKTREQMSAHFKLVREGSELSGVVLRKDRDLIARQLLKVIENYGTVVRRADKSKLIEEVERLRNEYLQSRVA